MGECILCDPALAPVFGESPHWRFVVNRNQGQLGKCMLVCRRHVEPVTDLAAAEWADLHAAVRAVTAAIRAAFAPDHFNYAFLQNQDRHAHLHVIPRYLGLREFAGERFDDPGYARGEPVVPVHVLDADGLQQLADRLALAMHRQAAP